MILLKFISDKPIQRHNLPHTISWGNRKFENTSKDLFVVYIGTKKQENLAHACSTHIDKEITRRKDH